MGIKTKIKFLLLQFPFFIPKRIIYSCQGWIKEKRNRTGTYYNQRGPWFKQIFSETILHLPAPKTIGVPNKKKFANYRSYQTEAATLYLLQNTYLMDHMGLILTKKHEVFQEFSHNFTVCTLNNFFKKNLFYTFSTHRKTVDFVGAVLISSQSHNYYHWLNDVLPRIRLYEPVFDEIDYFCVSSNVPTQFLDLLPKFGIPKEKIFLVDKHEKIFFNNLYVSSLPGSEGRSPLWSINYIREKLIVTNSIIPSKKVYFRRGNNTPRQILNEAEIIKTLIQFGFEIFDPGNMTVFDQINLMQQTKIIISAHGAALSNLLFAKENTSVIEIFSPDYFRTDCFYTLSAIMKLNYYYIIGEKLNAEAWGNIEVNTDLLLKTLNEIN